MHMKMNWDDLRIILAICEGGTFAAAAANLRIDETTVARRIARSEKVLGLALFEAADGKRLANPFCAAILQHIEGIERHVGEIRSISQSSNGPAGNFRIAATGSIAEEILAPRIGLFLQRHPGIKLRLVVANENVSLSRWEADFAIRLKRPERGNVTVSKLAELRFWLFRPREFAAGSDGAVVCAYPDDLAHTPESQYLRTAGLHTEPRLITDRPRIIRALILSGTAAGVLPEYLSGDLIENHDLVATPLHEKREIWLLSQNHLKRDKGARIVADWLRHCFASIC